jgi:hypothetical protein
MRSSNKYLLAAFLLISPFRAFAGFCTVDPVLGDQKHDFQFFGGYSPQSSTLIGTTTDRRFVLAGFSYGYRCWAWKSTSISYTGAIMPAAILLQPTEFVPSHAVYGFGITPIGLSVEFVRTRRLHPFLLGDGGIIASTEPIPVNVINATALNFLFDFGGGLRWKLDASHAVSVGYRFLHISNAGRTNENPGLDNNVFYLGFSFLR